MKTLNNSTHIHPISKHQPDRNATLNEWVDWFWTLFLPGWIARASDPNGFGYYDVLDIKAQPVQQNRRTVLAQARLLFTFSHLALKSDNPVFHAAAKVAHDALPMFRQAQGGYCRARNALGEPTGEQSDNLTYSYDQSFVILAIATWQRLNKSHNAESEIESCWSYIANQLTDSETGLLLEHNNVTDPTHESAPPRAQNPHMHLYEAALQAFEMSGKPMWLERAKQLRLKGLEYFHDRSSCTIVEFISPMLTALPGREGQRREIGHQCEWAWLLYRESEFCGNKQLIQIADGLLAFADSHGFASSGAMRNAAFDAVSVDKLWREERFLLWPQTEAIKSFAIRKDQAHHAQNATRLMQLVFQRYFANRAAFVNQLNNDGQLLWPDALSRLLYHLVLALTEGARAGLWQNPDQLS